MYPHGYCFGQHSSTFLSTFLISPLGCLQVSKVKSEFLIFFLLSTHFSPQWSHCWLSCRNQNLYVISASSSPSTPISTSSVGTNYFTQNLYWVHPFLSISTATILGQGTIISHLHNWVASELVTTDLFILCCLFRTPPCSCQRSTDPLFRRLHHSLLLWKNL